MEGRPPQERFPRIGTVQNPALFFDGEDLFLSYEIAPMEGGGIAVVQFVDVYFFEMNPNNTRSLPQARYPAEAWRFTEVFGSDRTERWGVRKPRFWTISFNDVSVEVVFATVRLVHEGRGGAAPSAALMRFLGNPSQAGAKPV